jgi:RNA polymerase sigma-70 factor (ECF subfamily)
MDAIEVAGLEDRIRRHCKEGDTTSAATALLEGYGQEILGFLIAHMRDENAAAEVFSQFLEDVWRGLDRFEWRCTARVWSYTLVRHAASRYRSDERRRRTWHVPLSQAGPLSEIAAKVRTATLEAYGKESRDRMAELRDTLPPEDQTLLILRVSRKLTWKEIARVMADEGAPTTEEDLAKEAVRLRKRYQLAKERLHRLAREQGLVAPKG